MHTSRAPASRLNLICQPPRLCQSHGGESPTSATKACELNYEAEWCCKVLTPLAACTTSSSLHKTRIFLTRVGFTRDAGANPPAPPPSTTWAPSAHLRSPRCARHTRRAKCDDSDCGAIACQLRGEFTHALPPGSLSVLKLLPSGLAKRMLLHCSQVVAANGGCSAHPTTSIELLIESSASSKVYLVRRRG